MMGILSFLSCFIRFLIKRYDKVLFLVFDVHDEYASHGTGQHPAR